MQGCPNVFLKYEEPVFKYQYLFLTQLPKWRNAALSNNVEIEISTFRALPLPIYIHNHIMVTMCDKGTQTLDPEQTKEEWSVRVDEAPGETRGQQDPFESLYDQMVMDAEATGPEDAIPCPQNND